MTIIERAVEVLQGFPRVSYEVTPGGVSVPARDEDGFSVFLVASGERISIWFDEGWHQEFAGQEQALRCFRQGLSGEVRLRVDSRGDYRHRWTTQVLRDDAWADVSTTGLLFFPFWRAKRTSYLRNVTG